MRLAVRPPHLRACLALDSLLWRAGPLLAHRSRDRLVRGFCSQSLASGGLEKMQRGARQHQREYCPKESLQYLTFLLLDPDKRSSMLTKLRLILADTDSQTLSAVLLRLDLLFKYRMTEHALAKKRDFVSIQELEAELSPKQRANVLKDYCLLVEALTQSLHGLDTQRLLELMALLNLSNFRSHTLATAIVRRLAPQIPQLDRGLLAQLIEAVNTLSKHYDTIEGVSIKANLSSGVHELLLSDFLDGGTFNALVLRLNEVMASYPSVIEFMHTVGQLLQLMAKYLKVGALSHSNKFYFFDKLSLRMYQEVEALQHADGPEVLQVFFVSGTIMQMGAYSPLILKVFRAAQRQMLTLGLLRPGVRRLDVLRTGLNTYASIGRLDYGLFEQLYKPALLTALDRAPSNFLLNFLPALASFAAKVNLRDRAVIELLVSLLSKHAPELQQQHQVTLRNLHLSLKFGIAQGTFLPEDKRVLLPLLNHLAAHCICTQHDLKLAKPFESPPDFEVCCVGCDRSRKFVLSLPTSKIEGGAQKYDDNHNERIIKSQLLTLFKKFFDNEVKVTTEGQLLHICLYKWDALLECPALGLKIGLEITGQGYRLDKDLFIKKKQMKFAMLGEAGYQPLVIDVTSPIYKNIILDFDMPLLEKVLAVDIYRQVKESFGGDLGFKPELLAKVCQEVDRYSELTVKQ